MSKSNQFPPSFAHQNQTVSFGSHRHADHPASAIRSGASSMPAAWQSHSRSTHPAALQSDESVRSFAEILQTPFVWCTATKPRQIVTGLAAVFSLIALLT